MYDLHCHLLPGIDDGPETLAEALAMARLAVAEGIQKAIVTPHLHVGRWDNDRAVIEAAVAAYRAALADSRPFSQWASRNVAAHKRTGYAVVTLSLKKTGVPPGDVTAAQMDAIAGLAERYSFGELRVTHEQNLVLADVPQADLYELWTRLRALGLATPNIATPFSGSILTSRRRIPALSATSAAPQPGHSPSLAAKYSHVGQRKPLRSSFASSRSSDAGVRWSDTSAIS